MKRFCSVEVGRLVVLVLLMAIVARSGFALGVARPGAAQKAAASVKRRTGPAKGASKTTGKTAAKGPAKGKAGAGGTARTVKGKAGAGSKRRRAYVKPTAKSIHLRTAFTESSQLRPMAQQLNQGRSPQAYAGVIRYAQTHTGEASAAGYMAAGHAYLLDRKFAEAANAFHTASLKGDALDDYADYLGAQADISAGRLADAEFLLKGFAAKYPDSIFVNNVPVQLANLYVQQGDPQAALRALSAGTDVISTHADFQFAQAKANQLAGNRDRSVEIYRRIYLTIPLSGEAGQAKAQLQQMGAGGVFSQKEREMHADLLLKAQRFADAETEYQELAGSASDGGQRNEYLASAAICDFRRTKHVNQGSVQKLVDSPDEAGAKRMYLLVEAARGANDTAQQSRLLGEMQARFATSVWREEALFTSGNMYLLRKEYGTAIEYFNTLAREFPTNTHAPYSNWRAAWLTYRFGEKAKAGALFDGQIEKFAGGQEIPAALYWRGRELEQVEKKDSLARAYYSTLAATYQNFYYSQLAQKRLAALGQGETASVSLLEKVKAPPVPDLTDDVPENDVHVAKARLLANAGLNEYIPAEIQRSEGSESWGAFAQAQIYASYGETFRAMQVLKRATPSYFSLPVSEIPKSYWNLLFPQPYWSTIRLNAERNGLDPYLVAALMRQESEFNPTVVSYANAYGLMQLLPRVGAELAKKAGIKHFTAAQLLNPETNIQLGTAYLRQTLEKFGGQPEYALAAYNAGDSRVVDWRSAGNFEDIAEYVESIPFTETRDYVEAILRNRAMYQRLYGGK